MRCISIARGTGQRCKNAATVDGLFCDVREHNAQGALCEEGRQLLEERNPSPAPDPVPIESLAPDPVQGFASYGEISGGDGVEVAPPGGETLDSLPEFPGPEAEALADPPQLDAELFRKVMLGDGIEPGSGSETSPEFMQDGPEIPRSRRQVWTPDRAARYVCPPLNRRFEKDEKDQLTRGEEDLVGEAVADVFNEVLSKVDPNNPWAALFLAAAAVGGPRYAPDVGRGLYHRVRGTTPPPRPSRNGQGAKAEAPDPTGEAPLDPEAASAALVNRLEGEPL